MAKRINTTQAPAAIGPYAQAVDLGNIVITSGQIPVIPQSNEIISDDIVEQTKQSLANIKAILSEAGLTVTHIVKTTVFVTDLNNFTLVNKTYEAFFDEHNAPYPARSCVEVSRLPKNVQIEIEAIAAR